MSIERILQKQQDTITDQHRSWNKQHSFTDFRNSLQRTQQYYLSNQLLAVLSRAVRIRLPISSSYFPWLGSRPHSPLSTQDLLTVPSVCFSFSKQDSPFLSLISVSSSVMLFLLDIIQICLTRLFFALACLTSLKLCLCEKVEDSQRESDLKVQFFFQISYLVSPQRQVCDYKLSQVSPDVKSVIFSSLDFLYCKAIIYHEVLSAREHTPSKLC